VHSEWERESRVIDNYSKVPHGLWTAPMTYGAKCLLGWLHSHSPQYLATLSSKRIQAEMGCSTQVLKWIDELVEHGFVVVVQQGHRHRYRLMAKPWDALAERKTTAQRLENNRPEPVEKQPQTGRKTTANRLKNNHIEEHVEHQREDHSSSLAESNDKPERTGSQLPDVARQDNPTPINARTVTAHYVDTFRAVNQSEPPQQSVKRVAQAAKQVLDEGHPPELVMRAAADAASGGHANLASSVTYLLANRRKHNEPKSFDAIRTWLEGKQ
jgi:DNA-binding PadR family transcriptional regulator